MLGEFPLMDSPDFDERGLTRPSFSLLLSFGKMGVAVSLGYDHNAHYWSKEDKEDIVATICIPELSNCKSHPQNYRCL